MSLKWKIIIGLALAAVAGVLIYLKLNSSEHLAAQIRKLGGTTGDVSSLDKPFLKAWLQGLKSESQLFTYQGRMYNTRGGRAA